MVTRHGGPQRTTRSASHWSFLLDTVECGAGGQEESFCHHGEGDLIVGKGNGSPKARTWPSTAPGT
jgi:hypothetical protein